MTGNEINIAVTSEQAVAPVQILETRPKTITWHVIWDHELASLTNISRPITLGLATTFLGGTIGLLPNTMAAVSKAMAGQTIAPGDVPTLIIAGGCAAATVAFGFFGVRGQMDARQIVRTIRNRRPGDNPK